MQRGSPEKKIPAQAASEKKKKKSCELKIPLPLPLPHAITFLMVRPLILRLHFKSVKSGIRSKRGLNMVFEKGLSYPSVLFF